MSLSSILFSFQSRQFQSMFSKKLFLWIGGLLVLTFLVFSPVLKAQFISGEDDSYLMGNVNILTFDLPHIKALLKERINGVQTPLTNLSLAFEHHFFGFNPFVFHFDNLILHAAVVVLVFFFARNLGLNLAEAFLGALIFAIHPAKVEAVAWIAQRKEMLYALFYLACLVSYQKEKSWLGFIFCFLSLLSDPMALSIPLVMVLMDWFNGKRINIKIFFSKWPYFLMVIFMAWSSYHAQIPSHPDFSPLIWIWSFVFYIQKFFIPLVSIPLYTLPQPLGIFSWPYFLSLICFFGILSGIYFYRRKWVVFSFLFYVLSVLCSIHFVNSKDVSIVAEHVLYLPSLGFCLLSAVAIVKLSRFLKTQEAMIRHLFTAAVLILILGLMLSTFNQSFVWHDAVTLWRHQIKLCPGPAALNNLAGALRQNPQTEREQINLYKQAIKMDSRYIRSYYNLAELYKDTGHQKKALIWYNKALNIDSRDKDVLFELGVLYQKMNKPQEAIDTFKHLLKIYPEDDGVYTGIVDAYSKAIDDHPQEKAYQEQREEVLSEYEELSKRKKYSAVDYFNLGFLYEQVGGYDEAIRFYKKSLELNPAYEKSMYNLANRYQEMGDLKTALVLYEHLVHVHPKFALGYLNMGVIYNSLGDVAHARMLYQRTLNVDPNNAGAYFNLGYLSEASGDLKEALNYYEKAVDINPQLAEGYYNIGNVYAALGQIPEAIASYLKTVGINKNHQNAYVNLSILSFKSRDFTDAIRYLKEAQLLGYTPPAEYLKSLEIYKENKK